MDNLRIIGVEVIDSVTLVAKFSHKLDSSIGASNVTITSQLDSVPSPNVLKAEVNSETLVITCQPMTPQAPYFIKFLSLPAIPFKSVNATAIMLNDDVSNQYYIIGPIEAGNIIQDLLIDYLRETPLNVTDNTTIVNKVLQSYSLLYSKALYDIKQLKNENYLSFDVLDEEKTRQEGPFDRLLEEGAYQITRVGKTPTGFSATLDFNFEEFPDFPVSLLKEEVSELLNIDFEDNDNTFNINTFTLNVSKTNVSKLLSVIFHYNNGHLDYEYPIETLGYQITNSKYDKDYGFSYLVLLTDQFRLSEAILNDPDFSNQNISYVEVTYEYRNLGRIIDEDSVTASTILSVSREPLPPIINIFNLKHAPIVDQNGDIYTTGGATFIDPNAYLTTDKHPAFLYEIAFRLNALPRRPGEYCIDYETGTVYVFGEDADNDGTGPQPPLISYDYQFTYVSQVDYVYDASSGDLVALPNGNLVSQEGDITFNYEEVLVPDLDYRATVHQENLSERIENKLLALNVVKAANSPITNVFRIFNETSGEIYSPIRWSNDKIYFSYNTPPNVLPFTGEKVSFKDSLNEILFVNQELTNGSSIRIFKCLLSDNNLVSGSEDCLASSINNSINLSNDDVFVNQKWFDPFLTESQNIDKLDVVGQYKIDYANGIVYVAVSPGQSIEIGTITYKTKLIDPINSHVISVDDIYYQTSILNPKDKTFEYTSFGEGFIQPLDLDASDEGYLNETETSPYQVNSTKVGAFVDAVFVPGVSQNIKFIRSLYELNDLQNSYSPINFMEACTFDGRVITVSPIEKTEYNIVEYNISDGYFITINLAQPYLSSNIEFNVSIIRNSDAQELWDNSGIVVAGDQVKLKLSGVNSPNAGDSVITSWSLTIDDLSRIIVDYNKGDLYIDYTYLADEILISYEYGENHIDFRQSESVSPGSTYYVSYKVGALRDALLKNFGSLVNIPELSNFDINLNRERYRDSLSAALESFIQGPTITAIKNIVNKISHIDPEIVESVFQNWSLGTSFLNPRGFETTGSFELLPAKYGNGALINAEGQSITLPVSSNLRLEKGSLECWVIPEWNGIDNDADITFTLTRDGYQIESNYIFIGSAEYHPILNLDGTFSLNKLSNAAGAPNKNKDGIFIYYNDDPAQDYKRWYLDVVDGYSFGQVDGYSTTYSLKVSTPNGMFYDVKAIDNPKPSNMKITSGTSNISVSITDTARFNEGFTFISDREHYLFDFGEKKNKCRFSIYKDPSGYLNFRIFDRDGVSYSIGADVSSWQAHEKHHVATAWKLNDKLERDELHLFIDGQEVPNIIRYGTKVSPYLHERYRTINPEEIAGFTPKTIIGSIDLVTTAGSPTVTSLINFDAYGILAGDTITIDEVGFNPSGYSILTVAGQTLTLSSNMPLSLEDAKFSVNKTDLTLLTAVDIYPNIAVSTISSFLDGYDLITNDGYDAVTSSSIDFELFDVIPGDLLRIDDGYYENHYTILDVDGYTLTLNDDMPATNSGLDFFVYHNEDVEIPGLRALRPSYSLSKDGYYNNVLSLENDVQANDLILIKTLGLNHKRIKQKYYEWGDGYNNVIKTTLPPPISLNEVSIIHGILLNKLVNSSNSTLLGNDFTSSSFSGEQPSLSDSGRTLAVDISSGNLDFSTSVTVTISGDVNGSPTSEVLTFTQIEKKNTLNKFETITGIVVAGKVINTNRSYLVLNVKEAYSITYSEGSSLYPAIRYSYQSRAGIALTGLGGATVTDLDVLFSSTDIGNYLVIASPGPAAGTYLISGVSDDRNSINIDGYIPPFSNGIFQILNTTSSRSGFQNGFFLLEEANDPGVPYLLKSGTYEFDFYTWTSIKFNPVNSLAYVGSDIFNKNHLNGVIDELKISSNQLTDLRIGETAQVKQNYITKDFNSLKELSFDSNTLVLSHFDSFPFVNEADFYVMSEGKNFVQSDVSVNDNFSQSLAIIDKPFIIDNDGVLDTRKEGTIEFWVNSLYDTTNDPTHRFYFDAAGINLETVTSLDDSTLQISGRAAQVVSVKLKNGDQRIDYFAGGAIETSTEGAIAETTMSITDSTVSTSKKILQVVTVKIVGDPTGTDYFAGGGVSQDGRTIYLARTLPQSSLNLIVVYKSAESGSKTFNSQVIRLKKRLPNQNSQVVVTYIPSGLHGDRMSIYKDESGYVNFNVRANDFDYQVRAPIFWSANSWHRIKATYSINGGRSNDQLHLFIDGYEYKNILFGTGLLFGDPYVVGSSYSGTSAMMVDIKFKDVPTELFIGTEFNGKNAANALIDNLRISNIARPLFAPFGESIDVNYSSNLDIVFPVTEDLYTTYLLDFNTILAKNDDFVMLKNKNSGIFDFEVNVFDSFDLIKDNNRVKEILEVLLKALKPANSRIFIKYE
jgi:hypothetical protein